MREPPSTPEAEPWLSCRGPPSTAGLWRLQERGRHVIAKSPEALLSAYPLAPAAGG